VNEEKEKDWRRLRSPPSSSSSSSSPASSLLDHHLLGDEREEERLERRRYDYQYYSGDDDGVEDALLSDFDELEYDDKTIFDIEGEEEEEEEKKKKKKKKSATLRGRLSTETRWYGYVLMLSMGTTKVPARGTRADVLKKKKTSCSRGMPCVRTRTDLRF